MFFSRLFHAIKFWFAMLLTGCMLLFVVVNHETVAISLFPLPYSIEMPKFLLALVCFGAGILVGGIMMGRKLTRALRVSHKSHQRAIALENGMKSRQNEEHALPQ